MNLRGGNLKKGEGEGRETIISLRVACPDRTVPRGKKGREKRGGGGGGPEKGKKEKRGRGRRGKKESPILPSHS